MIVSKHEGDNYRITCKKCGYDKVSSTEWGAEGAARSHRLDNGARHDCMIRSLNTEAGR